MDDYLDEIGGIVVQQTDGIFKVREMLDYKVGVEDLKYKDWKVGDSVFIPFRDGKEHEFIVAHKTEESTYFVSKRCFGESDIQHMPEHLRTIEENMPRELVDIMKPIRHVYDGVVSPMCGKVSLLARSNLEDCRNTEEDMMVFDLFRERFLRVSNDYYWTDTPRNANSTTFCFVFTNGSLNGSGASSSIGVRPAFKI